MKVIVSAALLLLASVTTAAAQEISETLRKPLRATIESTRQPIDLEFCIADAVTQVGGAIPTVLHDGVDKTLILGYGHTPKLVLVLERTQRGSTIKIYTKSGDVDARFTEYVKQSCKI